MQNLAQHMTPTNEQIDAIIHCNRYPLATYCGDCAAYKICDIPQKTIGEILMAKCAEVEELRGLINEVLPVGDIADGLAPYYIESDTIQRMRKALEGKEE